MAEHSNSRFSEVGKRIVRKAAAPAAAAVGLAWISSALPSGPEPVSAEKDAVCIPSVDKKDFTFTAEKNGIDYGVHAIEGSGRGEGDPCWDAAKLIVREAVGSDIPGYNQTVEIPKAIHPADQK